MNVLTYACTQIYDKTVSPAAPCSLFSLATFFFVWLLKSTNLLHTSLMILWTQVTALNLLVTVIHAYSFIALVRRGEREPTIVSHRGLTAKTSASSSSLVKLGHCFLHIGFNISGVDFDADMKLEARSKVGDEG